MNEELNKKLNEWAGTTDVEYTHPTFGIAYCFKWLEPKLEYETITFVPITGTATELTSLQKWGCKILLRGWKKSVSAIGDSKNPALALCLAIEKLISEDDNGQGI